MSAENKYVVKIIIPKTKTYKIAIPVQKCPVENENQEPVFVGSDPRNNVLIFLDMDGVIVQFIKGLAKELKIDYNNIQFQKRFEENNDLKFIFNIQDEEIWEKINKKGIDWWAKLKPFPWAKSLFLNLSELGRVFILSSPGKYFKTASNATAGKILWIEKHLPKAKYILTEHKWTLAKENAILIDDCKDNINQFAKYGGKTFLWPNEIKMLKNKKALNDSFSQIKKIIKEIKA